MVLDHDPLPPRVLNPKVNPDLEMIALKCLQKPPGLRYPSASAMADDLDAYLAGEPVSARSTSLRALATRLLAETHHAAVLETGVHSGCSIAWPCSSSLDGPPGSSIAASGAMAVRADLHRRPRRLGCVFWTLRRRGGPITFVERQLGHIWAAGCIGINLIFLVEWLLGLPVLTLAPMLAVTNGMNFLIKGGVLSVVLLPGCPDLSGHLPDGPLPQVAPLIFGAARRSASSRPG